MKRVNYNFNFTIVLPSALYRKRVEPTAYGLRKLGAQSDDDDVGPAAIAVSLAGRLAEWGKGGFPYPQHCELSSHLALERERRRSGGGKVWDEDIKEKRAIYSRSFWGGILKHSIGKIKGPTSPSTT